MAKGIRERLLKQAIKFHQWQEATYPGKTSEELGGEWEVDYPYSMRLRWFEDMDEDENRPYDMEEPNFFGLSIAYDPYMREVVQADRLTTCGGDGGCNICGGLGPFLGFLPCSPHCKPEVQEDKELNGDYDFYRPIIRLENYD